MAAESPFDYLPGVPYLSSISPTSLQTLDLWTAKHSLNWESSIWVIFIHGGAWRDPQIGATNFASPAISLISTRADLLKGIAGFASVNYRLSPYPDHPSNPSKPDQADRNVQHPAHMNDLLSALKYLQDRFHFEGNYVLVGHSCGATLAFQALSCLLNRNEFTPLGIAGVAGLYDLPKLIEHPSSGSFYRMLISNAYGEDSSVWKNQSPVDKNFDYSTWNAGHVILARCKEDEYVPENQVQVMEKSLKAFGKSVVKQVVDGSHDGCWQDHEGKGLVDCIEEMMKILGEA